MNVTLDIKKEITQEQKQAQITFHIGEITKLRIQLLNPNQPDRDILQESLSYHQQELNKYLRS